MKNCPNCNSEIGCSCQGKASLRRASDLKLTCSSCTKAYEKSITAKLKKK